jgi:MFS family permease
MQSAAQVWLVLTQLTVHSASALGWVMAFQFAPQLFLIPWTGLAADYFNQRRLLMLTQLLMSFLSLSMGILVLIGRVRLWEVDILALAFGCVLAFDSPARQAFVSELVAEEDLPNAVALNSANFNMARMIGPAAAGLVIGYVGTGWAFLLDSFSFLAVLISLSCMRTKELRSMTRVSKLRGSMTDVLRYVKDRPELVCTMTMLALIGTFGLNFSLFISIMAVRVFHIGPQGFGFLSSCIALGTIAGALLAAARQRPSLKVLLISAALFMVGCFACAIAPGYKTFAVALVVSGLAVMTFLTGTTSLIQLATEPSMRGRMMALRFAVASGGMPIGAPMLGWLADRFGPRWAIGLGALSGLGAVLLALETIRKSNRLPGRASSGL